MISNAYNNVYPVWKPKNITSSEAVRKIKKIYNLEKAGHCGTLDPFAEGVLIVLSGDDTKQSESYMNNIKTYSAKIVLGTQTDTLDPTGEILYTNFKKNNSFSLDLLLNKLQNFIGKSKQRPPCFSAKRINGVRLYKLARKDIFVHLKPIEINIENIELISFEDNELIIEVRCHKGVYIRQLAMDIAKSLGTIGYLEELVRTKVGEFSKENSIKLDKFEN